MRRVPLVVPHLAWYSSEPRTVLFVGEREHYMLSGRAYPVVLQCINGTKTVEQILDAVQGEIGLEEAFRAVETLFRLGYVIDVSEPARPDWAFWQALGVSPSAQAGAPRAAFVVALGGADPKPIAAALESVGFEVHEQSDLATGSFNVVLVEDYLEPGLEAINRRAIETSTPWTLLKLVGTAPWFGPLFVPGGGPCWVCLAHRLRANRPVETYLERQLGRDAPVLPPQVRSCASVAAAAHLAAVTLGRALEDPGRAPLARHLLVVDLARASWTQHTVACRPTCPACGQSRARCKLPLLLQARHKVHTTDGGHRSVSPDETFRRNEHLISPITGIITSLGPLRHRSHPLRPVYAATWFATPCEDIVGPTDFHRTSLGKGRTEDQARASALGEAIERWGAAYQGNEPTLRGAFADVSEQAIHPAYLLNFSEAQLARAVAEGQVAVERALRVPRALREDQPIDWCEAWSLTESRRRLLPLAFCYADVPVAAEERVCFYDSNGDAAGNCIEEAILQGFFELVERDAAAIWWYNEIAKTAVDLESFEDPYFSELVAHYEGMGLKLWVLDLTTDLGIATFCAYAEAEGGSPFSIGFGCHLDSRLAVQRALTELNQLYDPTRRSPLPWRREQLGSARFLYPNLGLAPRRAGDWRQASTQDLKTDVLTCVERARRAGLQTLVLVRDRPDIELVSLKVVVPGLRHFWPRYGPGRLYDVPVRLGWIAQPRTEPELNGVPLLL